MEVSYLELDSFHRMWAIRVIVIKQIVNYLLRIDVSVFNDELLKKKSGLLQ